MANEQEVTRLGDITVRHKDDGSPAGGEITFRAVRASDEFPVDTENHRMWFRASTPGMKGDLIDVPASAWKKFIDQYMEKNPIFTWSHQYYAEGFSTLDNVLGHAVDYRLVDEGDPDRDGLYLLDDFAYGINSYATMAWEFYMRRDLNAVSVGWDTAEYHTEKREVEGGGEREVYVIDTAVLLEHSGCILPMDTDALAQGRSLPEAFAARARAYAEESSEVEVAMRALAAGNSPVSLALRKVLDDPYCSKLVCDMTGSDPPTADILPLNAETKGLIAEVVREVLAELYREKAVLPEPEIPAWRKKVDEMLAETEPLTSAEIRSRLDEIKRDVVARVE